MLAGNVSLTGVERSRHSVFLFARFRTYLQNRRAQRRLNEKERMIPRRLVGAQWTGLINSTVRDQKAAGEAAEDDRGTRTDFRGGNNVVHGHGQSVAGPAGEVSELALRS